MKKIISAMLLITVLFASFPVWQPATAIELDDDIGFEYRDEVYYSDLFIQCTANTFMKTEWQKS